MMDKGEIVPKAGCLKTVLVGGAFERKRRGE